MNNAFYQSWSNQTTLHPLAAVAMAVLGLLVVCMPRRLATWPLLITACFIAPAQRVVIATVDFDLVRVIVLFGWCRILIRNELSGFRRSRMDTVLIAWSALGTLTLSLFSGKGFVNAAGQAFDAVGCYFLFRVLVRDWDDLRSMVAGVMWLSLPVAAAFIVESRTGRNLFAVLGGIPAITEVRNGRLRCQGAFAHSILAGCFWASLLPLIAAQWYDIRRSRLLTGAACGAALLIVVLCASSTPVAAVAFGLIGIACFAIRYQMRSVRWLLLGTAVLLHMVMEAPVWHLIARVDFAGGSTSWHRFNLIDNAISHVGEWWLVGSALGSGHWGYGTADVTNLYIVQCLQGGLALLALFIAILAVGFSSVGRAVRAWAGDRYRSRFAWALGVALLIHVTNFIAVSYFGQINMIWYGLLGCIGSISLLKPRAVASPARSTISTQPQPLQRDRRSVLDDRPMPGAGPGGRPDARVISSVAR